jgi:hypothetical protein
LWAASKEAVKDKPSVSRHDSATGPKTPGKQHTGYAIVEPAHMELAEPSIGVAFDRCIERGARLVVVHPCGDLPLAIPASVQWLRHRRFHARRRLIASPLT